jgi:aldose sugar dehydrogenase
MQQRSMHRPLIAALLACGLAACGGGSGSSAKPAESPSAGDARAVTFTSGLEHPWSLAFLPDGSMLVTERPGRLRHVSVDGATLSDPLAGVPAVDAREQGGLFDVVLDPAFDSNRRIYLSFAEPGTGAEEGRNGTAVARAELSADNSALLNLAVIFRQAPKVASTKHFGGRLVFSGDGTLFVGLGERYDFRDEAQDLSNHLGKVVRIDTDGAAPADNPFIGQAGAAPEVFSLGHRNMQGAALNPASGELWSNEHGPQGGDEVNRIQPGLNYGWPLISYGCEYGAPVGQCTPVGGASEAPGLEQPLTYWVPESIAPSGMAFYNGDAFPQWKGSVFIGALAGEALWRLTLSGNTVTAREALFGELGQRIRDVRVGADGWLYLLTDEDAGRIVRIQK